MLSTPSADPVLDWLVSWATTSEDVRALVLTSSRTRDDGTTDDLSDYDIVIITRVPSALVSDSRWIETYQPVLAQWADQAETLGISRWFRGITFEDGVSVDFMIWPTSLVSRITEVGLPENLDVGYRVILDKDGETASWPQPSFMAHIPPRPTNGEYQTLVSDFWWHTNKVAKALVRGDVVHARYILDIDLRARTLRQLLEWRLEIDHDWALRPGPHGRGLERQLDQTTWDELSKTYVSIEPNANWDALIRLASTFGRIGREVSHELGFSYPANTEKHMTERLQRLRTRSSMSGRIS